MMRGSQRFTTPETVPTETTWSARGVGLRDPFKALVILGGRHLCRSCRHRARSFKSLDGWIGWSLDRFARAFVKRRRLRRSEMPSIGSRPRFARPYFRKPLRATPPLAKCGHANVSSNAMALPPSPSRLQPPVRLRSPDTDLFRCLRFGLRRLASPTRAHVSKEP
jgi:hypothetical protein